MDISTRGAYGLVMVMGNEVARGLFLQRDIASHTRVEVGSWQAMQPAFMCDWLQLWGQEGTLDVDHLSLTLELPSRESPPPEVITTDVDSRRSHEKDQAAKMHLAPSRPLLAASSPCIMCGHVDGRRSLSPP